MKYWTTALLGFGLTMLLAAPLVFSGRPEEHAGRDMQIWVLRAAIYVCVLAFVWVGVAVLALLMIRSIRQDMMAERELNMRILLEKTLADHAKDVDDSGQAQSV